jgi:hypothetical protein
MTDRQLAALSDLKVLLACPILTQLGMAMLKDTLQILLPDLGLSTIEE